MSLVKPGPRRWVGGGGGGICLGPHTGKKSEIHTTKFAIAPLNP